MENEWTKLELTAEEVKDVKENGKSTHNRIRVRCAFHERTSVNRATDVNDSKRVKKLELQTSTINSILRPDARIESMFLRMDMRAADRRRVGKSDFYPKLEFKISGRTSRYIEPLEPILADVEQILFRSDDSITVAEAQMISNNWMSEGFSEIYKPFFEEENNLKQILNGYLISNTKNALVYEMLIDGNGKMKVGKLEILMGIKNHGSNDMFMFAPVFCFSPSAGVSEGSGRVEFLHPCPPLSNCED